MQERLVVMKMGGALSGKVAYRLWAAKDRSNILRYVDEFEQSQHYPLEVIRDMQLTKMKTIFTHAYENCPFYRESFDKAGVHPGDISQLEDISLFPILEKSDIQEQLSDLLASNIDKKDMLENRTGGSTGTPLIFHHNKERLESRAAATIRHDRWTGWDVGDWKAVVWGAARDMKGMNSPKAKFRNALIERTVWLNAAVITEESMIRFVDTLHRYHPTLIVGYANALLLFVRFLEEHGISVPKPKAVISTAEVLQDDARAEIERVIGSKVYNRHGCREVGLVASECSAREGMHINCESLYVEFLKDGRPAKPGEVAELIVTDLWNTAMPFLRYRICDTVIMSDKMCSCGRGLPMMKTVAGRVSDFLRALDGTEISGCALSQFLVASRPAARQVQIVQDKTDHILYRIVRGHSYGDDDEIFIRAKTAEFFGNEMQHDFEYVESIPQEASGKYRLTVRLI